MAKAVKYRSLGTFEFLVDDAKLLHRSRSAPAGGAHGHRGGLGVDLVTTQLRLAGGVALAKTASPTPRRAGMRSAPDQHGDHGRGRSPSRAAVRSRRSSRPRARGPCRHYGYAGYRNDPDFDSLLAKLIVHSPSPTCRRAGEKRACARGVPPRRRAQQHRLPARIARPQGLPCRQGHTRFVDEQAKALMAAAGAAGPLFPGGRDRGVAVDRQRQAGAR